MNANQIKIILSNEHVTAPYFKGVFSSDTIPILQKNEAIVVNTDKASEKGTHWLAFFMNETKTIEVFDSYGQSPEFYGIFIPNTCWNNIVFQSLSSNVCGAYCIYFIYKRCLGFSMYSVISEMCLNKINDFKMYQFVKKKYGVRLLFRK